MTRLVAELGKGGETHQITHRGRVKGVLMSAKDYESLVEMLEVLSDPEAMAAIKKVRKTSKPVACIP